MLALNCWNRGLKLIGFLDYKNLVGDPTCALNLVHVLYLQAVVIGFLVWYV